MGVECQLLTGVIRQWLIIVTQTTIKNRPLVSGWVWSQAQRQLMDLIRKAMHT